MTGHRDDVIWTASRICAVWCRKPCRFPARPVSQKQWCSMDPWIGRLGWCCFVSAWRPIPDWSMPRRMRSVTEASGFWVPDYRYETLNTTLSKAKVVIHILCKHVAFFKKKKLCKQIFPFCKWSCLSAATFERLPTKMGNVVANTHDKRTEDENRKHKSISRPSLPNASYG
jgi:hypothetical protein